MKVGGIWPELLMDKSGIECYGILEVTKSLTSDHHLLALKYNGP